MTEIKISDEMVEEHARAVFALENTGPLMHTWPSCSESARETYRDEARLHLTALVASGWRREAPTCQENAAPERFGVFVDTHLHECAREQGHRSAVHRCACNTEWWEAEQYVSAGTREGEDQERDEERQ
jgi:hypothetical protein